MQQFVLTFLSTITIVREQTINNNGIILAIFSIDSLKFFFNQNEKKVTKDTEYFEDVKNVFYKLHKSQLPLAQYQDQN